MSAVSERHHHVLWDCAAGAASNGIASAVLQVDTRLRTWHMHQPAAIGTAPHAARTPLALRSHAAPDLFIKPRASALRDARCMVRSGARSLILTPVLSTRSPQTCARRASRPPPDPPTSSTLRAPSGFARALVGSGRLVSVLAWCARWSTAALASGSTRPSATTSRKSPAQLSPRRASCPRRALRSPPEL